MKDLFEFKLTSLIFDFVNGWDITFAENVMPTAIIDASSDSLWMYLFNFDCIMFFERFITLY